MSTQIQNLALIMDNTMDTMTEPDCNSGVQASRMEALQKAESPSQKLTAMPEELTL